MSVSIIEDPQLYMNAYNNIVWTVDSTNKAQCDFSYVCDVYINAVYATRLKLFPFGTSGYASFKVNRVIEDYLSYDLNKNIHGVVVNDNSIVSYQLKFGEEYSSGCDGVTVLTPDMTTGTLSYAFNGTVQYDDYNTFDYTDFLPTSTTKRFLTDRPQTILIGRFDQCNLGFLQSSGSAVNRIRLVTKDIDGNQIEQKFFSNTLSTLSTVGRRFITIGVGPDNLNNTTYTVAATQPIINSSVHHYDIALVNAGGTQISERFTFEIDRRPTYYNPVRITWLNRRGQFDSYTFTQRTRRTVNTTRTEFNKLLGTYNSGWGYEIGDRGRTTLTVDANESLTLLSNWLTEEEALWFEELFTSPEVYIQTICTNACFIGTSGTGFSPDQLILTFTEPHGLAVNDSIFIDKDDKTVNASYDGTYTVLTVYSPTEILTDAIYGVPENMETGNVSVVDFVSDWYPVVVKTNGFEERTTKTVKNINYSIQVDRAYGKTIQRN